jgi:hypothetical protein
MGIVNLQKIKGGGGARKFGIANRQKQLPTLEQGIGSFVNNLLNTSRATVGGIIINLHKRRDEFSIWLVAVGWRNKHI